MEERPPYRLPRHVVPRRYQLDIAPDLSAGQFEGKASVAIEVLEPVTEIVLNAVNLTLENVVLERPHSRAAYGTVSYRAEDEQAILTFSELIAPGSGTLSLEFKGVLADDLRGFYRTTVTGVDGASVVIASTQCEATDARRVFPCWDEPDLKARFSVVLRIDAALTAISNARVMSDEVESDGKRRIAFAETMPMSTYLVALVVGPFQLTSPVMLGEVPIRIVARPGFAHLTGVAKEAALDTLGFFQEYFGIPYPADKIDHVAIPEFAAGAMENLGCVTYREELLLIDRERSSAMERMNVVSVIAHETAHMWFGDLVTMRWWNGIWLNEAFATFMQTLATDVLHPEWDVWTAFGPGRAYALAVDGLASTRPIEYPVGPPVEAWGMFDVLTYQKGGSVLRMIEQYLGPEVFRSGVSQYLTRHRYGNTETGDLWDALEAASGQPVRSVMDSWVLQEGYPLVRVEGMFEGRALTLSQQQFRYQGKGPGHWQIPVVVGIRRSDGREETKQVILGSEAERIDLPDDTQWVLVNDGGWGFYRVAYDAGLWDRLMPALDQMTALERLGLVDDVWAAVLAGEAPLSQAVRLWHSFVHEEDPNVWNALFHQLAILDAVATDDEKPALQTFIRRIARPVLDGLGWQPEPGEDVSRGRLRALLVRLLGTIGQDSAVQIEAHSRFMAHVNGTSAVSPDLLTAVVSVVAASGGEDEWDVIYREFKTAATPQDEKRYLYALADFSPLELVQRTLALYRSSEVRIQDGALVIAAALSNRHARRVTWEMIEEHWDEILEKYPQFMLPHLIEPIASIVEEDLADQTIRWLEAHPLPDIARHVAQTLEFQAIHRGLATRIRGKISQSLAEDLMS